MGLEALTRLLAWLRRPAMGLALTIVACGIVVGVLPLPLFDALDRFIYDGRIRSHEVAPDERVVVVDIDERSLAEQGRWPWSRSSMADLVRRLTDEGGAAVVGLDIVFAEPQREAGHDRVLVEQLRGRPVVLGYYFTSDRGGRTAGSLPAPVMDSATFQHTTHLVTEWSGYGANLADLQAAAGAGGFINPIVDRDGVVRALPLLAEYRGKLYESLVVSMLRRYLGNASLMLNDERLVIAGARGRAVLPLSIGVSGLVPFGTVRGGGAVAEPRFRYVSASDVIAGRVDPSVFRDRLVLVGTSAPGLTDLRATPIREAFPGVEIHATLLAAGLDGGGDSAIKRRSYQSIAVAVGCIAVIGGLLSFALPAVGAVGSVILSVIAIMTIWLVGVVGWANLGLVVPVATGVMLVTLLTIVNLVSGYFVEGRARRAVAGLFGEYVSPDLVDRMMRDPKRYGSVASEDRELTILFVDIRGFTRISETMQPDALREYINDFLSSMTDVVYRYGGTLDKYIGDAVMAFWGAPVDDPQHADHAVAAALSMLEEVQRLNRDFERRQLPRMRIGIGINTGVVRVGDMGSRLRRAYTVIGDPVNLASRFEGLTKEFDAPIIVGETTVRRARGHAFQELGPARVTGRAEPVTVYTPSSIVVARTRAAERTIGVHPGGQRHDDNDDKERSTGNSLDEGARIRL